MIRPGGAISLAIAGLNIAWPGPALLLGHIDAPPPPRMGFPSQREEGCADSEQRTQLWVRRSRHLKEGSDVDPGTWGGTCLLTQVERREQRELLPQGDACLDSFSHASAWMRAVSKQAWMGKHAFPQPYSNSTECTQGTRSHVPPLVRDLILKNRRFAHSLTWDGYWMAEGS